MHWIMVAHVRLGEDDLPILYYSEVGEDGYEIRRVEVSADGSQTRVTVTAEKPIGTVEEIRADSTPEHVFLAVHTTQAEFEYQWEQAGRE